MKFITRLMLWVIILDNYELDQQSERNIFFVYKEKRKYPQTAPTSMNWP